MLLLKRVCEELPEESRLREAFERLRATQVNESVVPDVVNKTLDEAKALLDALGISYEVQYEDGNNAGNVVIEQGIKSVVLTVGKGTEQAEATEALTAAEENETTESASAETATMTEAPTTQAIVTTTQKLIKKVEISKFFATNGDGFNVTGAHLAGVLDCSYAGKVDSWGGEGDLYTSKDGTEILDEPNTGNQLCTVLWSTPNITIYGVKVGDSASTIDSALTKQGFSDRSWQDDLDSERRYENEDYEIIVHFKINNGVISSIAVDHGIIA